MEITSVVFFKFIIAFFAFHIFPGLALVFFLFKKETLLNTLDKIFLSIIFSPLVLVIISAIEELSNIPQNTFVLSINILLIGIITFYAFRKGTFHGFDLSIKGFNFRKQWPEALIYLLFVLILLARVVPATLIFTPITADPIAHTMWLRTLNTTFHATTEFWYPQGLEYFLNYYATFVAAIYPKIVLLSTNFFAALFPIATYYLLLLTTKTKERRSSFLFAFIAFCIASAVPYPHELFYTGGKNSFIFALSAMPVILLLAYRIEKLSSYVTLAFLTFSILIIHYPSGAVLYLILVPFLLSKIIPYNEKRFTFQKNAFRFSLIFVVITFILLTLLSLRVLPLYKNHPPSEDLSVAAIALSTSQPIKFIFENLWAGQSAIYAYKPCPTISFIIKTNVCKEIGIDKNLLQIPFFGIFLVALVYFLLKRNAPFLSQLISGFIVILTFNYLLFFLPDHVPGTFFYLEVSYILVIIIVPLMAWLIWTLFQYIEKYSSIKSSWTAVIILFTIVFLINNAERANTYVERGGNVSTRNKDIESFQFISDKLPNDNKKILIKLYNIGVIVGPDSGVFIPAYTGRAIEVDWLHFSSAQSFKIFDLFTKLVDNANDQETLHTLVCEYNIGYVFSGSLKEKKRAAIHFDEAPNYYQKLFDNGARVYAITNISCAE